MSRPYRPTASSMSPSGGPSPKRPKREGTTGNSSTPNPYKKKHADDNDSVEVVSPRPQPPPSAAAASMDCNTDDEVMVESSNATNPNVVFSHTRPNCGVHPFSSTNKLTYCEKCFCCVCNVLASECKEWSEHCHSTEMVSSSSDKPPSSSPEVIMLDDDDLPAEQNSRSFQSMGIGPRGMEIQNMISSEIQSLYSRSSTMSGQRKERDMRLTDLLSKKMQEAVTLADAGTSLEKKRQERKMEGDVPQLVLHKSFFVEGVRIGWPFPVIMPPQRQMALHLIKALKKKLHVVLESPTGTGKSAAILCSVLAWQRYHAKTVRNGQAEEKIPKIIYCSRTHSQVAQMIASLKKTPYRPRMAVLGSRDRLCIHKEIINRNGSGESSRKNRVNVNNECRIRVSNTEKIRKALSNSRDVYYDDNDPPLEFPGDGSGQGGSQPTQDEHRNTDHESGEWILARSTKKLTCPHYRQLATDRQVAMARSKFVLEQKKIDCCTVGGEKTKLGVHDIEDLVAFGVNPYVTKDVAIYREGGNGSFGMKLQQHRTSKSGCSVNEVFKTGAAGKEGTVKQWDRLLSVNGKNVRDSSLDEVTNEIKSTGSDPLLLDVLHDGGDISDTEDEAYSSHSACPYYLSRELSKHAELIFAPYNYVLDPAIRSSLDIDLAGAVVVLDEAHNVEDTLKESGSGKFGEVELCEILTVLSHHAAANRSNLVAVSEEEEVELSDMAHELLLFVEKLVLFLRKSRESFEQNPGKRGAAVAIQEYQRFHTPDDNEFEVTFDGPNGKGVMGNPVGCRPFFDKIMITKEQAEQLSAYATALEYRVNGGSRKEEQSAKGSTTLDRMVELVSKFTYAVQAPEHFYVSCVAQANGSLDFASGLEDEASQTRGSRFKKKPKALPFARPRSVNEPTVPLPVCVHKSCRVGNAALGSGVRHGDFCDGSTNRWEAHLVLKLLSPGNLMTEISSRCRTVVLASGSLAPIPSLCGELDLIPKQEPAEVAKASSRSSDSSSDKEAPGRLQLHPKPLEANHVIDLQKQLFAVSIGEFPDRSPLTVTYSHYKNKDFFPRLGHAIASVIEAIPRGGVLVFFPSYTFLKNCIKCWNPFDGGSRYGTRFGTEHTSPDVWDRFLRSKGKVIVEPSGSQEKFEAAKEEYTEKIKRDGNSVLLAVFRGKMSEGISFNDDNARGVICVGLPLPNSFDRSIQAKKDYNDEQRKLRHRYSLLPGRDWYSQQAYRAIGQALGRCIRHAGDYGTVVLMDSRHCDDGAPIDGICRAHQNLPKWMRHHVRTLHAGSVDHGQYGANPVLGGYRGLSVELKRFFSEAPKHSQAVIAKWKIDLEAAREREKQSSGHSFNSRTGAWTATSNGSRDKAQKEPAKNSATLSPFFKITQDSPTVDRVANSGPSGTPEAMVEQSENAETPKQQASLTTPVLSSPTSIHSQQVVPKKSLPGNEKGEQVNHDENMPENGAT